MLKRAASSLAPLVSFFAEYFEMQFEISQENAAFLQSQVTLGSFKSPDAALDAAIDLLKRRAEIREHVLKGCEQLDRGEYVEFADDESLEKFFSSLFGDVTEAADGN